MQKNVFIAYNHSDESDKYVSQIADKLKDMGLRTWLDKKELKPGDSIKRSIEDALDKSSYVIAVIGPKQEGDRWMAEELKTAIAKHKKVIPVIVGSASDRDLPDLIKDRVALKLTADLGNIGMVYDSIYAERSVWGKLREYIIND